MRLDRIVPTSARPISSAPASPPICRPADGVPEDRGRRPAAGCAAAVRRRAADRAALFAAVSRPYADSFGCRAVVLRPESRGQLTSPRRSAAGAAHPTEFPRHRQGLGGAARRCGWCARSRTRRRCAVRRGGDRARTGSCRTQIDAHIRATGISVHHPLGTCRMGTDRRPDGRRRRRTARLGIDRLRVVDASVMPDLVGGNINAPVIMIAEKAADLIRGREPSRRSMCEAQVVPRANPRRGLRPAPYQKLKSSSKLRQTTEPAVEASMARTTRRTVLQTAALGTTAIGDAVCARGACRREAVRRVLGPLGARRQRAAGQALPRMGREGKDRHQRRFHHLQRRQGSVDRRRRGAGQDRARHHAAHSPGTRRAMPTTSNRSTTSWRR